VHHAEQPDGAGEHAVHEPDRGGGAGQRLQQRHHPVRRQELHHQQVHRERLQGRPVAHRARPGALGPGRGVGPPAAALDPVLVVLGDPHGDHGIIRCAKNTGLNRLPSRQFAINAAWVELALTAADLIAWTQTTLLDGDLAMAEPATLRYRLLHVAARIARGQRRLFVRIDSACPWRQQPAAAFARLHALPQRSPDRRVHNRPPETPTTTPAAPARPDPEHGNNNPIKIIPPATRALLKDRG